MLYCFLDTNIFIHFTTFDEIDWLNVLDTMELCLVVPMKVIQELDKLKRDPASDWKRKRASLVLRKIDEFRETNQGVVRKNVSIQVEINSPTSRWLEEHGYDPSDADDCIVAAVARFASEKTQDLIVLFTDDSGPRLKATSRGIKCVVPPAILKLKDESDPLQKENQRLKQELMKLQLAQPNLAVKFETDEGKLVDQIDFLADFEAINDIQLRLDRELARSFEAGRYIDKVDGEVNSTDHSNDALVSHIVGYDLGMIYPSREEVDAYHVKLKEYIYTEYRDYLIKYFVYHNKDNLLCRPRIMLINSGMAPGKNIDVQMHFPDGLEIFEDVPNLPEQPFSPPKPRIKTIYDRLVSESHFILPTIPNIAYPNSIDFSGPSISIEKTNSYEVNWGPDDLKHNQNTLMVVLNLLFEPTENQITAFDITYEISADNLPVPSKGTLKILVCRK